MSIDDTLEDHGSFVIDRTSGGTFHPVRPIPAPPVEPPTVDDDPEPETKAAEHDDTPEAPPEGLVAVATLGGIAVVAAGAILAATVGLPIAVAAAAGVGTVGTVTAIGRRRHRNGERPAAGAPWTPPGSGRRRGNGEGRPAGGGRSRQPGTGGGGSRRRPGSAQGGGTPKPTLGGSGRKRSGAGGSPPGNTATGSGTGRRKAPQGAASGTGSGGIPAQQRRRRGPGTGTGTGSTGTPSSRRRRGAGGTGPTGSTGGPGTSTRGGRGRGTGSTGSTGSTGGRGRGRGRGTGSTSGSTGGPGTSAPRSGGRRRPATGNTSTPRGRRPGSTAGPGTSSPRTRPATGGGGRPRTRPASGGRPRRPAVGGGPGSSAPRTRGGRGTGNTSRGPQTPQARRRGSSTGQGTPPRSGRRPRVDPHRGTRVGWGQDHPTADNRTDYRTAKRRMRYTGRAAYKQRKIDRKWARKSARRERRWVRQETDARFYREVWWPGQAARTRRAAARSGRWAGRRARAGARRAWAGTARPRRWTRRKMSTAATGAAARAGRAWRASRTAPGRAWRATRRYAHKPPRPQRLGTTPFVRGTGPQGGWTMFGPRNGSNSSSGGGAWSAFWALFNAASNVMGAPQGTHATPGGPHGNPQPQAATTGRRHWWQRTTQQPQGTTGTTAGGATTYQWGQPAQPPRQPSPTPPPPALGPPRPTATPAREPQIMPTIREDAVAGHWVIEMPGEAPQYAATEAEARHLAHGVAQPLTTAGPPAPNTTGGTAGGTAATNRPTPAPAVAGPSTGGTTMPPRSGVATRGNGRTLRGTPIGEFRHPWVDGFVEVHGDVLQYVPHNIPDFMAYWMGLSEGFVTMGQQPGGMGARLTSSYPIAAHMHGYMINYGATYPAIAQAAGDVLRAYVAANPHDAARALQPRNNEQWANVGVAPRGGYAGDQINRLVHAHGGLFAYEPTDPVDLQNFFCALPFAFITMQSHVAANQTWLASYFPGAANIPGAFYQRWSSTYAMAGVRAAEQLEGYNALALGDLTRHLHGRVNEERADV